MEFKDRLKELRINANLKQEEAAKLVYVSRTLVSKWEAGVRYPNEDNLDRLAEVFQISRDELIGKEEEPQRFDGRKRIRISLSSVGKSRAFDVFLLNRADIFAWVKVILSVGLIPLWFVEFFMGCSEYEGMAALYSFSMYKHTEWAGCAFLSYVSIGLLAIAATGALYSFLRQESKPIRRISHYLFGIVVGLFVGIWIWAAASGHGFTFL